MRSGSAGGGVGIAGSRVLRDTGPECTVLDDGAGAEGVARPTAGVCFGRFTALAAAAGASAWPRTTWGRLRMT
jgi:hypothetical protein